MGAPGLAFETWDPRSERAVDTHDVTKGDVWAFLKAG